MLKFLAIFLGGGIGALLRFGISTTFKHNIQGLVISTFISNLLAGFLLGVFAGYILVKNPSSELFRLFAIVGLCGGFSTFSTFSMEALQFFEQQQYLLSLTYIVSSILACVLSILGGIWLSKAIF